MSAYSRLKRVLREQELSIPELHRRIGEIGIQVNLKSLYRLSQEDQPVERLDLRVAGAICRVCAIPLSEWIVFEEDEGTLRTLAADKQKRLDLLMAKNNEGQLAAGERHELQALVREAEELALANARLLAGQRARLRRSPPEPVSSAS